MSDESRRMEQAQRDLMRAQRALGAQARRYRALRERALVLAHTVLGDAAPEHGVRLAAEHVLEIVVGDG